MSSCSKFGCTIRTRLYIVFMHGYKHNVYIWVIFAYEYNDKTDRLNRHEVKKKFQKLMFFLHMRNLTCAKKHKTIYLLHKQ